MIFIAFIGFLTMMPLEEACCSRNTLLLLINGNCLIWVLFLVVALGIAVFLGYAGPYGMIASVLVIACVFKNAESSLRFICCGNTECSTN